MEEEVRALQCLSNLVTKNYVDKAPRHYLLSAQNIHQQAGASVFCILNFQTYVSLSAHQIQDIFRYRHIVITDIPSRKYSWSRETLGMLGSLTQDRDIHGMS